MRFPFTISLRTRHIIKTIASLNLVVNLIFLNRMVYQIANGIHPQYGAIAFAMVLGIIVSFFTLIYCYVEEKKAEGRY